MIEKEKEQCVDCMDYSEECENDVNQCYCGSGIGVSMSTTLEILEQTQLDFEEVLCGLHHLGDVDKEELRAAIKPIDYLVYWLYRSLDDIQDSSD